MNITDALQFANEVFSALGHAEQVFHDPMFLARFASLAALVAGELATAHDDETRRGICQVAALQLTHEFAPKASA